MKAQIVTKAVDSRTNRKAIKAGEKGKGAELWACTYWPDSSRSVESMEQSLFDWLQRHPTVKIVEPGTHGGARPGAGRKPLGDTAKVRVTVTLPAPLVTKATELGDGNTSKGVEMALKEKTMNAYEIYHWLGTGWYAPRQENGAVWYYWCGDNRDQEPSTYPMGLGTPDWLDEQPAANDEVEVKLPIT